MIVWIIVMQWVMFDCVTDSNYVDPIGPQAERPRTAARRRDQPSAADEFTNDDIADDLLPD